MASYKSPLSTFGMMSVFLFSMAHLDAALFRFRVGRHSLSYAHHRGQILTRCILITVTLLLFFGAYRVILERLGSASSVRHFVETPSPFHFDEVANDVALQHVGYMHARSVLSHCFCQV